MIKAELGKIQTETTLGTGASAPLGRRPSTAGVLFIARKLSSSGQWYCGSANALFKIRFCAWFVLSGSRESAG